MKAVHFGAGNIGRGFVGLLLHEGGYELVFSDVAAPLVDAINAVDSYTVHEVGEGGRDTVVTGFRALNSAEHPDELIEEVAGANIVTTAVGPTILKFVAPHIVGAPQPEAYASTAPAELAGHFAAASLAVSAIFWSVLGFLCGAIHERLAASK